MEKFPGHGVWWDFSPLARPARRTGYFQIDFRLIRPLYPLISFTKTSHWSFLVKAFAAMTSRCSKAFTKTSDWSFLVKAFEAMTSHGGDVAENV